MSYAEVAAKKGQDNSPSVPRVPEVVPTVEGGGSVEIVPNPEDSKGDTQENVPTDTPPTDSPSKPKESGSKSFGCCVSSLVSCVVKKIGEITVTTSSKTSNVLRTVGNELKDPVVAGHVVAGTAAVSAGIYGTRKLDRAEPEVLCAVAAGSVLFLILDVLSYRYVTGVLGV